MHGNPESIEAKAFPRGLNLPDHDNREKCLPGSPELDGDGPENTSAVIINDLRRTIGNEVGKLQDLAHESPEVVWDGGEGPRAPRHTRQVFKPVDSTTVHEEIFRQSNKHHWTQKTERTADDFLGHVTEIASADVIGYQEAS